MGKTLKVGAGSVVLKDVPSNSTVVGVPGRVVIKDGVRLNRDLNHSDLPDPISERLSEMEDEIARLQVELAQEWERGNRR